MVNEKNFMTSAHMYLLGAVSRDMIFFLLLKK